MEREEEREEEGGARTGLQVSSLITHTTEDLYLQGPKQVGPVSLETFFKNS